MEKENKTPINRRDFIGTTAKAMAGFMIVPRYVLGGKKPDGSLYIPPSDVISLGFIGAGKQAKGLTARFIETKEI